MNGALAAFPHVHQAVRIGRVLVDAGMLQGGQALMTATLMLWNDGKVIWPAATQLRLVTGPYLGVSLLPIAGEVFPGNNVELTLQLNIPADHAGRGILRAGWVLECNSEPFG